MGPLLALSSLVFLGCAPTDDLSASWFDDPDGDGFGRDEDCAESDPTLPRDYYTDADGDGFGGQQTVSACERPEGAADAGGDCDDADARVNPAAAEACNGKDDNCDGATDGADSVDPLIGYLDEDGDGWGDALVEACVLPTTAVAPNGDCDDSDAMVFPGATELCNGIDDDCDAETDEDDAADALFGFMDADGDGYGSDDSPMAGCQLPEDAALDGGDCEDDDPSVSPGADELCDGTDNDCDGDTDEACGSATARHTRRSPGMTFAVEEV